MGEADPIIGIPLFGGYHVSKKIGAGGMGAVYLVENKELNRKLAVKVLLTDRSVSAQTTARFLAEARAASAIHHKNIIDILDCSQLPDGRHYILMEFLDGMTVRRYNKRKGPLSVEKILSILVQVCSGLAATHQRRIVHRDLKPSNIIIAPTPENPLMCKILDFGIAKLEDPLLAGEIKTRSQAIAGTPHYMSPEQARALRDVDHRTDVYSVGAIAYELLTGRLPYQAHSIGELVFQQTRTRPSPPIEINPDVPREWSELVMRALHVDLESRTPTVVHLATEMADATENGMKYARFQAPYLFDKRPQSDFSREDTVLPMAETIISSFARPDSTTRKVVLPADAPVYLDDDDDFQHSRRSTQLSEAEAMAAIQSLSEEELSIPRLGSESTVVTEAQIERETPVSSRPPQTQQTVSAPNRLGVFLMLFFVAVIAGGIVIMWHRSQEPSAAAHVEEPMMSSATSEEASVTSSQAQSQGAESSQATSSKSSRKSTKSSKKSSRSRRSSSKKSSRKSTSETTSKESSSDSSKKTEAVTSSQKSSSSKPTGIFRGPISSSLPSSAPPKDSSSSVN